MGVKVRERPKGSGIYWIFIDHQGKRKSKRIGTNEKLARDVAKKIEAKLILGQLDLQPKDASMVPKFSEYAEVWLGGYGKTALKYSTLESYRIELRNHISPASQSEKQGLNTYSNQNLIYSFLISSILSA